MERFIIEGGRQLSGTITPSGNKNAALPLLAATLLTDQQVILHNIPRIGDVRTKLTLLQQLGIEIEPRGDNSWALTAATLSDNDPDAALARKIRTSIQMVWTS